MRAVVKKIAKKAPAKKAPAKKAPAKKAPAKKAPAKKAPAKKAAVKKAPAKKAAVKKAPGKPFPAKAALAVAPAPVVAAPVPPIVTEERRLVMPPPPRPVKNGKKAAPLKPIKSAPTPVVVSENESPWSAAELKTMKSELSKELLRLKAELVAVETEMDELIHESGEGAGDDQADAGTKTFEREHEMSLVINARDMVLQTERALERIEEKTYGQCEECGNAIGKARLQVFPRATLCMVCKAKEERR
ncbi:MAG: TraR/DksA family transcriptional regulator [Streptomycetaceae bacterium]|nr:MAG: TraR/DksA family transcriptional regulator [Streptomycetaceae bacterium]